MKKYQIAAFIFCILLGCVTLGSRQGTAGPAPQTVTSQEPGKGDHAVTEPSEAVLSVASKDSDTNSTPAVQAKNSGNEPTTFVIIIAVEDYMREEALHFTRSDALKFQNELIGYNIAKDNIFLLTTGDVPSRNLATKDRIEEVIGAVLGVAKEGDTIIIYMGGHGAEYNGVPYFCPLNAGDSLTSLVSIGEIITAFGRSKATFKMMIVDACRNGETSGAFAALKVPQGVMLLQSSGSGETSIELRQRVEIGGEVINPGGLFTIALVEGLQGAAVDNSGNITLLSLAAYTMKRTPVLAKMCGKTQTPHLQGNMTDMILVNAKDVRARQVRLEQEHQTSPPPSPEEIAQAHKNVEDTVERLLQVCLEKFADDNKNSIVNPYNNTTGLAFEITQIIRDSFPNNNIDMKTAAHGKSEFGKEQFKKDVIDKPVQAALEAARKQWNADKEKEKEAEQERLAAAEQQKQQAIADLKRIVPGTQDREALYTALKGQGVLAKKGGTGDFEFRYKEFWLDKNALGGELYGKLIAVGTALEYGCLPTDIDLALKVLSPKGKNQNLAAIIEGYKKYRLPFELMDKALACDAAFASTFGGVNGQVVLHGSLFGNNPNATERFDGSTTLIDVSFKSSNFQNLCNFLQENRGLLSNRVTRSDAEKCVASIPSGISISFGRFEKDASGNYRAVDGVEVPKGANRKYKEPTEDYKRRIQRDYPHLYNKYLDYLGN